MVGSELRLLQRAATQHIQKSLFLAMTSKIVDLKAHSAFDKMGPFFKHSGLQNEVLSLYRRLLRIPRTKPIENRMAFRKYIVKGFHEQSDKVSKKDIATVEYLLRRGKSHAKMLEDPNVDRISGR